MTPEEFVYALWKEHGAGDGWGEIWAKDHRTGKTYARGWVQWPASVSEIREALAAIPDSYDRYVTTPIFRERKRDYKNTWPTRWVWLDVDNGYTGDYPPSVKLQTGWHTTQAYWYLKEPIEVVDAVAIGKRLQKRTGSDPEGSWICKPLRIPGYVNGKEEYRADPPPVKLIYFDTKRTVSDLPREDESIDDTHRYPEFVADHWSEPSDDDRSVAAFRIYGALRRSDFTKEQIKEIAQLIPWIREKWPDNRYISADVDRFFSKGGEGKKKKTAVSIDPEYMPTVAFGFGGLILGGQEKPFLVEGWLRQGSWQMLHGDPKTYKSAITHHLVMSVITGVPAFGKHKVHRPGPVLIIDWENTVQTYRTTLLKLGVEMAPHLFPIGVNDSLIHLDVGASLPLHISNRELQLDDEAHQSVILKIVAKIRPSLIVVDTLTSCAPGLDINDILAWQEIQPFLESLCTWNASLLVLHHNKKATKDVSARGHMMSGTHKLYSWAEGVISTTRVDEEKSVDIKFAGRFETQEPLRLTAVDTEAYDEENKPAFNNFKVETLAEAAENTERERTEKDMEERLAVRSSLIEVKVAGVTIIQRQLKKHGIEMSGRKVKAVLERMVDDGMVVASNSKGGRTYAMFEDQAHG